MFQCDHANRSRGCKWCGTALEEALRQSSLNREDIDAVVTTGYGRTAISDGDKSITEITCHARVSLHFLDSSVRTVVDIGGQDSKAIRLNDDGSVKKLCHE